MMSFLISFFAGDFFKRSTKKVLLSTFGALSATEVFSESRCFSRPPVFSLFLGNQTYVSDTVSLPLLMPFF